MLHLKLQTGLQILFSGLRNRMVYQSTHQKEKKKWTLFYFYLQLYSLKFCPELLIKLEAETPSFGEETQPKNLWQKTKSIFLSCTQINITQVNMP